MSKGSEEWKMRYRRVLAMSPRELADRLRQQATARFDFFRHEAGWGFEPTLASPDSFQRERQFFFSSETVPILCSRLRDLFPREVDEIIERARHICRHHFDLLGYKDLDYGAEIDWHCDLVHGKRAPRKPWFRIRYLDFEEVGDSKVTWELNRHQHWVTLAKAFRLTGDDEFAAELFRQWKHWHKENPYPIGINWASSLEVAFRSLSWVWVYFLMSGSSAMPAGFPAELASKLAVSARHIECYLSTYFSPNTHLIGEAAALFFIGTLCPNLSQAARWQRRGWEILLHEANRQVRSDGLHFEQSIYYHVYAIDLFLHSAVLASRNGIAIPPEFNRILERMLEALCILGQSGPLPGLGDDDGGRLFNPQRNQACHLLDPLAIGAVLFGRSDLKNVAGGLREETLWLLGEKAIAEFNQLPTVSPARNSRALQNSGLYVMTDDDAGSQLVIDAGPQGADTAGHSHADALSVTANICGCALLIDTGTFEYVDEGSERNRFRGTKAHNTMVVDGMNQSEPKGPFSWGNLPNVKAETWIEGKTFDLFVGSHDGYTRLPNPVLHRRSVFSRKSRFWLVRDQALGQGKHQLELLWHLSPELLPVEQKRATFRSAHAGLSILGVENQEWSKEIFSDDWSPAYGRKERHCVLRFGTVANLPTEFLTLLIPAAGINSDVERFTRMNPSSVDESVVCYGFKTAGEDHYVCFGRGEPWTMFAWRSDAEFLYWSQAHDKTGNTLICCNASYLETDGRRIMACERNIQSCEMISDAGGMRVTVSDPDAVVDKQAFSKIRAW